MFTIWKYPIELKKSEGIEMPYHSDILRVDLELGKAHIYAVINTSAQFHIYWFRCFYEGEQIDRDESLIYIGAIKTKYEGLCQIFKLEGLAQG